MNTCSTASPVRSNCSQVKCGQMNKNVSNANHVSLMAKDCKNRQGPGHATAHSQGPRERPSSRVSTSSVAPCSHQRRWSADFYKCGTSPVIIVKKSKKEPQPPQRGDSLLRPHPTSHSSVKRYSCPPTGFSGSPGPASSSSSSSSTSSCSSPPPVRTSDITGHDPLGWKLRPKSSSMSPQARNNRLSLQISLPVIFPDPKFGSASNPQSDSTPNPDPSPKTKPPLRPKPPRRHHSESSAFLRSLATPLPVVTLDELCGVQLRRVSLSDESDDVFGEGNEEEEKVTTGACKTPPPVPEKTSMARQIAQLIAHSRKRCRPVITKAKENIYSSVIKPKPKLLH